MVDLSYTQGIDVVVDTSKITLVTPLMYENAFNQLVLIMGM